MIRCRLYLRLPAIALCLSACATGVRAQSPAARDGKPLAHAAAASSAPAHVRLWKADLHGFPALRVTMTTTGGNPKQHPAPRDLGGGGPGYLFNNYADLPAGKGTLEVFDAPGTAHPLVSVPAEFGPGAFVTVLLAEPDKAGAPPQVEIIADGTEAHPGDSAVSAQVRVRNFVADLKDIRVSLGDAFNAQFTGSGNHVQMSGLKPAVYPVKTVGTGVDGKPFEWTTEADLRLHHSQTLLIFPDPYGRIRPRMSVDCEAMATPAPAEEGQR